MGCLAKAWIIEVLFGKTGVRRAEVVIEDNLRALIYYFCTPCNDFGVILIRGV